MIYTFGDREAYEYNIANPPVPGEPVRKAGLGNGYGGGIAFKTAEEAKKKLRDMRRMSKGKKVGKRYIDEYNVYGLDCDWENTYLHEDGTQRLIKDAAIIVLDKQPEI